MQKEHRIVGKGMEEYTTNEYTRRKKKLERQTEPRSLVDIQFDSEILLDKTYTFNTYIFPFSEVQAIMRTIIFTIVVLLALQNIIRAESATDIKETNIQESVQNSKEKNDDLSSEIVTETVPILDKETKIKVEKNLLTLFGMSKRPKPIDRSKIVIPEAMKALYSEIMGEELRESVNIPKPGLLTKSANTVRSFLHEGKYHIQKCDQFFLIKCRGNLGLEDHEIIL